MESRTLLRYAAFLAVMALSAAKYDAEVLAARTPDPCHQICGPEVECEEPCLFVPEPPFEAVEITCGEFEGGGSDGYCLGECGDDYCNEFADETIYSCEDDCGSCGDSYCDSGETCSSCSTDCGVCPGGGSECNDEEPEDPDCDEYFCNPQGSCCSGLHVQAPSWECPWCLGCASCDGTEVCRPSSVSGHVWCITKGANCTGT